MSEARARITAIASAAGSVLFWENGGGGLSAGRNQAFRMLSGHADWAVTTNDTSILDATFSESVTQSATTFPVASCLVGTYAHDGTALRSPGDAGHRLLGRELWLPIEPACVWNVADVLACGGFDERIGTGSAGSAQSGEGTDLLVRLSGRGGIVAAPGIVVHGRPHAYGLSPAGRVAKDYAYAVGTGVVYRRHFAGPMTLARVFWPAIQGVLHAARTRDGVDLRCGLARARGRAYGYFRPEQALRTCGRGNASDRWRSPGAGLPTGRAGGTVS